MRESEMEKRLVKDRDVLRQFLREIRAIAADKKYRETTLVRGLALDEIRSLAEAALCNSEPLEDLV